MTNLRKNVFYLVEVLGIAALYYVTAKIGQTFAIPPGNITPIWLPSGIMLALIIIRGYKIWPGIFLGAFSGNATAYMNFTDAGTLFATLFSGSMNGIGDVLCMVLAVYLMKKYSGSVNPFKNMLTFWQFLIFGVAFGPLISALFGVASLTVTGIMAADDAPLAFMTWWVGDSVGALLITPAILAFYFRKMQFSLKKRSTELMLYIMIVTFISVVELSPGSNYTLIADAVFLMIPLIFWSIFRFGHRITYVTILYFFSISLYLTSSGHGIFSNQIQLFSLLQMQMYFMVVASSVFIIGALVEEQDEIIEQMSENVSYDTLTHAGSRLAFEKRLEEEIGRVKRYNTNFSLVICDLDDFKKINDEHGHLIGDESLKYFVSTIQKNLRKTDSIYRWGGEEFIVLLPETGSEKAYNYAEKMRINVADATFPNELKLTISIGVCQYDPELSKAEFLKVLDSALYESKESGRNRTTLMTDLKAS